MPQWQNISRRVIFHKILVIRKNIILYFTRSDLSLGKSGSSLSLKGKGFAGSFLVDGGSHSGACIYYVGRRHLGWFRRDATIARGFMFRAPFKYLWVRLVHWNIVRHLTLQLWRAPVPSHTKNVSGILRKVKNNSKEK